MIYLDSNATTAVAPEVVTAMLPFLTEHWANPSADYAAAREVRRAITQARADLANLIGADPDELLFTSSATESINAVHASVRVLWPQRPRLIIGATEHAAVLASANRWQESGGLLSIVPVLASGVPDLDALAAILAEGDTALVSIMWANNETGVLAPMEKIVDLAHSHGAQVHTDAVQVVGKMAVDLSAVPIDYLSLSGHKFHACKGIGALFISRRMRFNPWIIGGGQENGRRSGTENVPGIVAIGAAARLMANDLTTGVHHRVASMRNVFERAVLHHLPDSVINGADAPRLGTTTNLTLPGIDAAGLLILLDKADVSCSAGSACHTASVHPSHVLEAMGLDRAHAASTLRFSFCRDNTAGEIDAAVAALVDAAQKLRLMR